MTTVHFYTEISVAAQLIYSLSIGDDVTAHAAASELAASDDALLFRILCFAWWLSPADHPLQNARAVAFQIQNSHALFSALLSSSFELPDYKTPQPQLKSLFEMQAIIKKRKTYDLYAAALAAPEDVLAAIFPRPFLEAAANAVFKPMMYRILEHAAAALTAYPSIAPSAAPWSASGRTFAISDTACLAWNIQLPSPDMLRGDPHKLIQTPVFENIDMEIAFYEKHFPDDIPDEWSDSIVSKSHRDVPTSTIKNPWRTAFLDCF